MARFEKPDPFEAASSRILDEQNYRFFRLKTECETYAGGGRVANPTIKLADQIQNAFVLRKNNSKEAPTTLVLGKSVGASLNAELREALSNENIEDRTHTVGTFLGLQCTYVPTDDIGFEFGFDKPMV